LWMWDFGLRLSAERRAKRPGAEGMGKDSWQIAAGSRQKKRGSRHRGKRAEVGSQSSDSKKGDYRSKESEAERSKIYDLKYEF